jgi:hypothetical protein
MEQKFYKLILRFFQAGALLGTKAPAAVSNKALCSNRPLGAKTINNNMIFRNGYFMGRPLQTQAIFSSRRKQ